MAGFMAGFGPAFSRSYELAKERRHDTEKQDFAYRMQDYMAEKERRFEWEKTQGQYAQAAKSLAAGDANPEQSYQYYMQALNGGFTPKQLLDMKDDYTIEAVETPTAPESPTVKTTTDVETEQNIQSTQKPSLSQRLFGGKSPAERKQEKSINRIADITGDTPDQVRQTISGERPQNMKSPLNFRLVPKSVTSADRLAKITSPNELIVQTSLAIASGNLEEARMLQNALMLTEDSVTRMESAKQEFKNYVIMEYDENGKLVPTKTVMYNGFTMKEPRTGEELTSRALGPDAMLVASEDIQAFGETMNKETMDARSQQLAIANMVTSAKLLDELYKENPGAGSWSAELLGKAKEYGWQLDQMREMAADFGNARQAFSQASKDLGWTEDVLKNMSLEDQEEGMLSWLNAQSDRDQGRGYVKLTQMTFAFDYLRSRGQEGRAVSVQEFETTMAGFFESPEPGRQMANLKRIINSEYARYSNKHRQVQELMSHRKLGGTYFWDKDPSDPIIKQLGSEQDFKDYVLSSYALSKPNEPPTEKDVAPVVWKGTPQEKETSLQNARKAIQMNPAKAEEIKARLKENGIDPEEL